MKKEEKEEKAQNSEVIVPLHQENGKFAPGHQKVGGKVKGTKHWSTLIGRMLQKKIKIKVNGQEVELTMDEAMVESMLRQAIQKGDVKAFEALTNRHEGKPHQSIDLEVSEPPVPIMPIKKRKP